MGYAITVKIVYEVRTEHEDGIIWEGIIDKDTITETEYLFNMTTEDLTYKL